MGAVSPLIRKQRPESLTTAWGCPTLGNGTSADMELDHKLMHWYKISPSGVSQSRRIVLVHSNQPLGQQRRPQAWVRGINRCMTQATHLSRGGQCRVHDTEGWWEGVSQNTGVLSKLKGILDTSSPSWYLSRTSGKKHKFAVYWVNSPQEISTLLPSHDKVT